MKLNKDARDMQSKNAPEQPDSYSQTIISQRLEIERLKEENKILLRIASFNSHPVGRAIRIVLKPAARILRFMKRHLNRLPADGIEESFTPESTCLPGSFSDRYAEYILSIPRLGPGCETYVPDIASEDIELNEEDVKYIAFYLPQYHSFPENDRFWGRNFTEWTNVTKAVPLFPEHYQPRLAGDLGYYSLKDKNTIAEQMRLAKKYGIYGFCIYYYWFDGKTLMSTPLDLILHNPDLKLPFCICWANENWTRRWDGNNDDILIEQTYSEDFAIRFIQSIAGLFSDSRYIRRNNRPLLVIYNANQIPNLKSVIQIWRNYCRTEGIGEIYISAVHFFPSKKTLNAGFDDFIDFPPHLPCVYEDNSLLADNQTINPDFSSLLYLGWVKPR